MAIPPRLYDVALRPIEASRIGRLRRELIPAATGRILDVGAGTGANVPHLPPGADAVGIDVDAAMLERARRRPGAPPLVVADAGALPFPDASFDTVLFTLVLCTVPDPAAAVAEARRVLRPGGKAIVIEHVRAPGSHLARLQRTLAPAWARFAGGCRLDRDTARTLRSAGFSPAGQTSGWRGMLLAGTWLRDPRT